MNGSAAGCSGRFPSGLAFLRGCSDDSFRSRLAAPPGAGMAVSLRNRVALKILRASGGGFRPWRTDFALQPRPVSSEALWPCSRSLVLFGTESVLLQDRGIRRSVIDVLSVLPHRVGPSVIVDSQLASRPHGRPSLRLIVDSTLRHHPVNPASFGLIRPHGNVVQSGSKPSSRSLAANRSARWRSASARWRSASACSINY